MGDHEGANEYPSQDTTEFVPRRRWTQHPAVAVLMGAAIVALLALSYRASVGSGGEMSASGDGAIESDSLTGDEGDGNSSDTEEGNGSSTETDDAQDAAPLEVDADGDDSGDSSSEGADTLESIPPPDSGPYVSATLNIDAAPGNGLMVLSGRVPNQAIADAVLQAAEISYAPFVESQLEVDETLPPAPWLEVAPRVVGLLPSVTDGTIMVADERILVAARSPNPNYLEIFQGGLALFGQGMPVEVVDTLITDLDPPLFAVKVDQGSVTLDGFVPSQAVIELLAGGAEAVYGPDQVTNNLTVDDSTYSSFWMQTMPGVFQLFQAFPAYQFTVEDGAFSGAIQGGVNFATDSTEISPQAAQALDIGVAVLARDISIGMLVTGHTDSQGPEDYNQALSEARAQSVVDYFVASGIDPARLIATGAGESQPVADNETDEGRAQNRRVEFIFGPASALGG